jgi:hypothetical protein
MATYILTTRSSTASHSRLIFVWPACLPWWGAILTNQSQLKCLR